MAILVKSHPFPVDGSWVHIRRRDTASPRLEVAEWAKLLGPPVAEPTKSRRLAHLGAFVSIFAIVGYLVWRITSTLPHGTANRTVAWILISFEAAALLSLVAKTIALWNIDAPAPPPVEELPVGSRLVVLIPTYNEPRNVIAPTVSAACALQPAHETWVLDDGDREWVAEMAEALGARYVNRKVHDHAKAGNINNALRLMVEEDLDGTGGGDIIAVLDCDHVPLPTFLTATLGWFADPTIAIVQCPQDFYNQGAFDDDGFTGEQGLFFNVLMPARQHAGVGPFWCGSTSLLRVKALLEVGGVATESVTEDMHTTLKLLRIGWRTVYHHQTVAVGLAPGTAGQYLIQRRRWGLGAMQVLRHERLWTAKRWMSWRNFYEYLSGTLWWLEGIATMLVFAIPLSILLSGAQTSTAKPLTFTLVFAAVFITRLWGAKRLLRGQIHWPTAFALRVFRVPIGLGCLWWLISRRDLEFEVTPKGGEEDRYRGKVPRILLALTALTVGVCLYAVAGVLHQVPWRTTPASTVASGLWIALAGGVLVCGLLRIRSSRYATSRRDAPRVPFSATVRVNSLFAQLVDVSVGGASVRIPAGADRPSGLVNLRLPGERPITVEVVPPVDRHDGDDILAMRVSEDDWESRRRLSLWLFHTPDGAVPQLPAGVPVAAVTLVGTRSEVSTTDNVTPMPRTTPKAGSWPASVSPTKAAQEASSA